MSRFSVLFVCTENVCRSPLAEALLRKKLKQTAWRRKVHVDSAGTYCSAVGLKPDPRILKVGKANGLRFWGMKARRVDAEDFHRFDLILAMDEANRKDLLEICPDHIKNRVALLMGYAPNVAEDEVPDPYYGNAHGFLRVYELLDEAIEGLLIDIGDRLITG